MRLQTKLSLGILPIVAAAILGLGYWSVKTAQDALEEATRVYMTSTLMSFVQNEVQPREQLLEQYNLQTVPSYVEQYQQEVNKLADILYSLIAQKYNSAQLMILTLDGEVRLWLPATADRTEMTGIWKDTLKEAVGSDYVIHQVALFGEKRNYTSAVFQPWDWILILSIGDDELNLPGKQIQIATLLATVSTIIFIFVYIFLFFRRFVIQPISGLKDIMSAIENHEQLPRASEHTQDELGELTKDMDKLAATIADHEEQQQNWNRELEEQVEKRTAQLAEVNNQLETFTYSVSHDLKAPLRGIDGYSCLLQEDYADKLDEQGKTFLNNIIFSAAQMNQLIDDLLLFSQTERRDLTTAPIDIISSVDSLIREREHELEEYNIRVGSNLDIHDFKVDSDCFRQVLGNLLDNAIKFSKKSEKPKIQINATSTDSSWIISISDNGIGFDPQQSDKIFEIFERLNQQEEYPGTGIGLAIVKKGVSRMGGSIRAESTLGQGSTFLITLPRI
jgi:signal transduction histidine kinase